MPSITCDQPNHASVPADPTHHHHLAEPELTE
jgi:hypothetical protein